MKRGGRLFKMRWLVVPAALLAWNAVIAAEPVSAQEVPEAQEPMLLELEALDLRQATITLYTVDPGSPRIGKTNEPRPQPAGVSAFHDWKVLGSKDIPLQEEKKKLLQEFIRGFRDANAVRQRCFFPRHALRIKTSDRVIDFVICFECHRAKAYGLGEQAEFSISGSPQDYFTRLVGKYALRLSP